jgi:hypothetical protein
MVMVLALTGELVGGREGQVMAEDAPASAILESFFTTKKP